MIIDTPPLHYTEMASSAKYVVPGTEPQDSADGPLVSLLYPKILCVTSVNFLLHLTM